MKKQIIMVGLLAFMLVSPAKLIAEDKKESPCMYNQTNKECVQMLVNKYSKKYNVSAKSIMNTLENENDTFDFDRQSELKYKKGNRWKLSGYEQSYGVAMIHLPDHPEITLEQATDPEFSIEFMAKQFSLGKQKMWMGYKS